MDVAVGLILVLLIALGVMYAVIHAIGFVLTIIGRSIAGLGRLVLGPTRAEVGFGCCARRFSQPLRVDGQRRCHNDRCQHRNPPMARYCARCGQPLV